MSDALSFAELDGQQVELLPARTVLSTFTQGADGGTAIDGTDGVGVIGINRLIPGGGNGYGTPGSNADGG
ncbi:MAG: hypothetical protein JO063_04025 [Pseudonocardiales bacterium]|nr:hypothetical protein [Pseudonocardiales bacterium]MBV9032486.1 hypothetical protein [Pseudonocardiales bacterium]MBW0009280.1 hypothetical protein [Pseudonocardiales bacterium]